MKRYIIGFIFGAIIFSFITAYAATTYYASQINYNNTTVDNALDNLYTSATSTITNQETQINSMQSELDTLRTEASKDMYTRLNLSSSKVTANEAYGTRLQHRTTTLNVSAKSYIIAVSFTYSAGATSGTPKSGDDSSVITINDNNECTRLSGRYTFNFLSNYNNKTTLDIREYLALFSCKFKTAKTITIDNNNTGDNVNHISHIMAQAIKLD